MSIIHVTKNRTNSIELLASEEMQGIAKQVYKQLQQDSRFSYSSIEYTTFANGEIKPKIPVTVRHKDVYVFHSLYHPDPNTSYMKLLLTNDAISRASANSITLVLPFMTYVRQDRKDEPRVPISAKVVADLVQTNKKVERILTLDMHCDQAQGFYNMPVDNLYGSLVHADYFKQNYENNLDQLVVVSPDHGGVVRAKRFATSLKEDMLVYIVDKRRTGVNKAKVMHFIGGSVENKDVILYDDMIDTGGSIIAASNLMYGKGARKVYAVATHGLFSNDAYRRFDQANIEVVVTDSIPRTNQYQWLTVLPTEELLAKAVYESSVVGGSVSTLFEERK